MTTKLATLLILAATATAPQTPQPLCLTSAENIKLNWLTYRKVMDDAMYEMDMHWSFRLALAEQHGQYGPIPGFNFKTELAKAPRTLGDGLPYPEHYYNRAQETKSNGTAEQAMEQFKKQLAQKYGNINIYWDGDGKACTGHGW